MHEMGAWEEAGAVDLESELLRAPGGGRLGARLTRGRMADVAIEATGDGAFIPAGLPVLKPQGRFLVLGCSWGTTHFDFNDLCISPSYTIVGAHNRAPRSFETPENPLTNRRDCELFFDMILDGDTDLAPLVGHRIGYAEAPQIYAALLEDRTTAMGAIFEWR